MRTTQADANEEIMNRIRELRKAAGYTQEKLASVLCVSQANLSGWELNKWQPDQDALNKMADLFNVSIDYLLGRTENAHDPLSGWTEEEKAAGVGRHPTYLSEDEMNWLELRSEILRLYGEKHLSAVVTMLETWINKKD